MKRFLVLLVPIVALTVVASACTTSSSSTTAPEVVEIGASGGGVAVVPAEESPSGLTVNATGRTTMPSSEVFVIVVPEPDGFGPFPEGLTSNDRAQIKDSIQALGIPDEDIDFPSGPIFSPFVSVVRVRVDAADLPGIG